jgi:hypothetical protein
LRGTASRYALWPSLTCSFNTRAYPDARGAKLCLGTAISGPLLTYPTADPMSGGLTDNDNEQTAGQNRPRVNAPARGPSYALSPMPQRGNGMKPGVAALSAGRWVRAPVRAPVPMRSAAGNRSGSGSESGSSPLAVGDRHRCAGRTGRLRLPLPRRREATDNDNEKSTGQTA